MDHEGPPKPYQGLAEGLIATIFREGIVTPQELQFEIDKILPTFEDSAAGAWV